MIIGAGGRGTTYAEYALQHPDQLRVVGVAEPQSLFREGLVRAHNIPAGNIFTDWQQPAAVPRLADAVVIATLDDLHTAPAIAFARLGYHILLEKPMAPTEAECAQIVAEVKRAGVLFGVCHVLRYTPYTRKLKEVLDSGAIGEVVSIQHLEPVGYWHQAHSFVRGKWAQEKTTTFMLMAKSCHDLDWMRYIVGRPCRRVSSFGHLTHFRPENKPAGAADRCLDCAVEADCPYSAKKIYVDRLRAGETGWPVSVVAPQPTEATLLEALRTGPYGLCVYGGQNDVVDHQVVSLEFEGGRSGVFTMTGFTEGNHRVTRVFGTRGEAFCDGHRVRHFSFLDNRWHEHSIPAIDGSITAGHGGGDYYLMQAFVEALRTGDASKILSGPDESLETHRIVFAAESARRNGTVVAVDAQGSVSR